MGPLKNSGYADYLGQNYHNKAKIESNSASIAEICNAEVVNLDIKMRAHKLLEGPITMIDNKTRCFGSNSQIYADYHDDEWGKPIYDDIELFEFLILEGAQAGLNWETILKRREGYRKAFHGFDPVKVASMSDKELDLLRLDASIIRNKLKIYSARKNARVFLGIQKEFGSFAEFLWGFIDYKPTINNWQSKEDVPATSTVSDKLSKELKSRGMSFVGSTIIYAYMQACGLVDDHVRDCWLKI